LLITLFSILRGEEEEEGGYIKGGIQ